MVAGGSGLARSPWLGQLAWQLLALLDYAQCEALLWSLSFAAASGWGWGWRWQTAPSGILLGVSLGL